MKFRYLAATAAAALVLGAFAPVAAANAEPLTLTGVVTDENGPVPYAVVGWVEAGSTTGASEQAYADENGAYSLDTPVDGDYLLYANFELYEGQSPYASNPDYNGEYFGAFGTSAFTHQIVEPFTEQQTGTFDVELTRPGSISGVSVDFAGETLSLRTLGGNDVDWATVDDDGNFAFDGLVPGDYTVYAYDTVAYQELSVDVSVNAGETTELSVEPAVTAVISGVVKVGGKAVKGVVVQASSTDGNDFGSAKTTSSGAYSIKGLNAGTYTVSFSSANNAKATASYLTKRVTLKSVKAGTTAKASVSLSRAGVYAGKVALAKGANYYEVTIVDSKKRAVGGAYGESAKTGFSIAGLAAGKYTAFFTDGAAKYYAQKSFTIKTGKATAAGTTKLTTKTITYSGTVTGAKGGSIYLASTSRPGTGSSISSKGTFAVKGVIPGSYTIYVNANGASEKKYSGTISKSVKKTLSKGKALGYVTGVATIGGTPVEWASASYSVNNSPGSLYVSVTDGAFAGYAPAGTAELDNFLLHDYNGYFPAKSPFWFDLPAEAKTISLVSAQTTDLGTFELVVRGALPVPEL